MTTTAALPPLNERIETARTEVRAMYERLGELAETLVLPPDPIDPSEELRAIDVGLSIHDLYRARADLLDALRSLE